jgi:hypothetical protein
MRGGDRAWRNFSVRTESALEKERIMNHHKRKGMCARMILKMPQVPALVASFCLFSLLAGCAGRPDDVILSDEGRLPHLPDSSVTPAKVSGVSKLDETKIESQVFSYLLARHFWEDGAFTAIFLQADDREVEGLRKKFRDHVPPIKASNRIDLRANQTPLDKDTGRPAIILSVDLDAPAADGSVPAIGKWYGGAAITGFYSFILKKNGDDWEIQNPQ